MNPDRPFQTKEWSQSGTRARAYEKHRRHWQTLTPIGQQWRVRTPQVRLCVKSQNQPRPARSCVHTGLILDSWESYAFAFWPLPPPSLALSWNMPYVDIHSTGDYASIYYTTNSPYGNVSGFDPDKPTLIILHPMFLDSSWLEHQFGDPRLDPHYNIIAFDMRTAGKSTCRNSGRHDSWVDAADLAICHQKLNLPPCHIFALEALAVTCALRFALLFPEMCLSLALCNVPSPTEPKWTQGTMTDVMHAWCFAEDYGSLELAAVDLLNFFIGPNRDADLQDEVVAYWMKHAPPLKRPWLIETLSVLMNRTALSAEAYAEITQPVLIIHGERNEICPRKHSEALATQLTGSNGGAVIYTVRGASTYLSIIPGSASIVNQTLAKFISRIPHTRAEIVPPEESIPERMQRALKRQGDLLRRRDRGDDTLDPACPLSFSCLSETMVEAQMQLIRSYCADRWSAYNPLGPDGRPLRMLSASRKEQRSQCEKNGVSVAATKFPPPEYHKRDSDKPPRAEHGQVVRPGHMATPTLDIDKFHTLVRVPMAKVMRDSTSAPITRLLMH